MAGFVLLVSCGGSGPRIDAARITLELRYAHDAAPEASLTGQPDAAPGGATITCRSAHGRKRQLGTARADGDGAFSVTLDPEAYPTSILGPDFMALNDTLECRADGGEWVHPLQPPRVAIE